MRRKQRRLTNLSLWPLCAVPVALFALQLRIVIGEELESISQKENGLKSISQACDADSGDISVMLVLDRSASMGDEDKIVHARNAAVTFLGFLQPGDGAGVVSFNHEIRTDIPFWIVDTTDGVSYAQSVVDTLTAYGATSIGGAMQRAQLDLSDGRVDCLHNMLLLSDGKENVAPFVADILPGLPLTTTIHTVGLGYNSDGALLSHIASQTNGSYHFAPTADELQYLYMLLRGTLTGLQIASAATDVIANGATQRHRAIIDASTSFAIFSVTSNKGSLDFSLARPDGRTVSPELASSDLSIVYAHHQSYVFYSVENPEAGEWDLIITCDKAAGVVKYSAVAQVASGLWFNFRVDASAYGAGEPVLLTASLDERGLPVLAADVVAEVRVPAERDDGNAADTFTDPRLSAALEMQNSGHQTGRHRLAGQTNSYQLQLHDDGFHGDGGRNDGVYGDYFHFTLSAGSYSVSTRADGNAPAGGQFTRRSNISTYVAPSARPAITSVFPDSAMQGETVSLSLSGANLSRDCELAFSGGGLTVTSLDVRSSSELEASVSIAAGAQPGLRDLTVRSKDGSEAFGPALFTVAAAPQQFALQQNYPNPFNAETIIRYHLPAGAQTELKILNILGQEMRILVDASHQAGYKTVTWDGRDRNGQLVPSGVYFYRLSTPEFVQTNKLVVLR